jgi:hypothetical protein
MKDKTVSGAAFGAPQAPRAFEPVTRGGVATGQLRDMRSGRFGGKAAVRLKAAKPPAQAVAFDEELLDMVESRAPYQPIVFEDDAIDAIRERLHREDRRRRLLSKAITVGSIALVVFLVIYFAGQLAR